MLDEIIHETWGDKVSEVLDAACGIGTQSLGLAKLGYQVTASDPDNDTLIYSVSSEKSVNIDSSTGLIAWDVPEGFMGNVPISIHVKDSNGGEAIQKLTLSIQEDK